MMTQKSARVNDYFSSYSKDVFHSIPNHIIQADSSGISHRFQLHG